MAVAGAGDVAVEEVVAVAVEEDDDEDEYLDVAV